MATVDDHVTNTMDKTQGTQNGVGQRRPGPRGGPDNAEVLLRNAEVARRLQVSTRTVLAWAQAGKLPSVLTPGGHRRYPQWGVDEVLRAMTGTEGMDGSTH